MSRKRLPYTSITWRPAATLFSRVDPVFKVWLLDMGSLTERLINHFKGNFRVELQNQYWGNAQPEEAKALKISCRERVLIREVILYGDDLACVFARSIIPQSSISGRLRALTSLNNQPLGAWLFRQPDLRRGALEVANLGHLKHRMDDSLKALRPSWGRRSIFYVENKPILVAEIFLSSFTECLSDKES